MHRYLGNVQSIGGEANLLAVMYAILATVEAYVCLILRLGGESVNLEDDLSILLAVLLLILHDVVSCADVVQRYLGIHRFAVDGEVWLWGGDGSTLGCSLHTHLAKVALNLLDAHECAVARCGDDAHNG